MHRIFWLIIWTLLAVSLATAQDWKERHYRDALCAGWDTEVPLPGVAGRADCESPTHIIEVDWAHNFKYGVGQAIVYSQVSEKIPGLILICKEGKTLCPEHGALAEEVLSAYGAEATVWHCPASARVLADCRESHLPAR